MAEESSPMSRSPRAALYAVLGGCLVVRLLCLPSSPFFADAPDSVAAIESGKMYIQFPGYVPFHLVVAGLAAVLPGTFAALVAFNLLCGLLAVWYIALAAELFGGRSAGLMAGVVAGFGLMGTYFSVAGNSYITDLLAVAGVLYHGLTVVGRRPASSRHILWAMLWCSFGILMRPLSGIWMLPAVLYLAWKYGAFREWRGVLLSLLLSAAIGILISAPYYGSFSNVVASGVSVRDVALEPPTGNQLVSALVRLAGFPFYFFHVWLLIGLLAFWQARRRHFSPAERQAGIFLLLLAAPYCAVLLRHIPQAGYFCYLTPLIIVLPFIFRPVPVMRLYRTVAVVFAAVGMFQLFAVRPLPPANGALMVADAYFFQYSRWGLKRGMFETLSSLALKSGTLRDQVPEGRRRELLQRNRSEENEHP